MFHRTRKVDIFEFVHEFLQVHAKIEDGKISYTCDKCGYESRLFFLYFVIVGNGKGKLFAYEKEHTIMEYNFEDKFALIESALGNPSKFYGNNHIWKLCETCSNQILGGI